MTRLASNFCNPDNSDWTPFESHSAFELAEFFFKDDQTSARRIDRVLNIMSGLLAVHDDQPPFLNHQDLYQTIDAIPLGGVPWQSFTFTYEGPKPTADIPKWMDAEYTVWFRDPHRLFLEILKNPDFVDSFDYAPYRQYDKKGNRQYEHFMSGDWAWKQAVRICGSLYIELWNILMHFFFSRILLQKHLKTKERCLFLLRLAATKRQFLSELATMSFGHYTARLAIFIITYAERMAWVLC